MPRTRKRIDLPTGQDYGQRSDLEAAQSAVAAVPDEMLGLGSNAPRQSLVRPTEAPREPLMSGLAGGDGPGPEAIVGPGAFSDIDQQFFIEQLPILEGIIAGRTRTSQRTINLVRRLRAQLPPEANI